MPVPLDTHDPDINLTPGTTKSDIVAYLYNNPEYGYKPAEIREHLDIPHGTVTTTLTRLHDQGLIGKTTDSHYHALEHREDLRRYVGSLEELERMFEDKDFEERTDWENGPPDDVNEDELDAEIAELEAEMDPE